MPKLRQNIITGDWVVIAPERSKRPEDFVAVKRAPKKQLKQECPFCPPKGEAYLSRIKEVDTKHAYVVTNKFPAFVSEDEVIEEGGSLYPSYKSIGGHEVISLLDHDQELEDAPLEVLLDLFSLYQNRILSHEKNPVVEYVMIIHNFGSEAGASIDHPHSQLFASSVMPSYITKEIGGAKKYYKENKECVFCRLVEEEGGDGFRVIAENDDFIAFTFFAARFPFESWIVPKKHNARFERTSKDELKKFVEVFSDVQKKLAKTLSEPAYNYFIHTSPARLNHTSIYYHWHLEIIPRVSNYGGYELGSGIVIDVVSPESAARFLRGEKD